MTELLYALVGVLGAGVLGFGTACALGQLVPGGRLDAAQVKIAEQRKAYDALKDAHDALKATVDRQALVSDVTNAVLAAVRSQAAGGAA